jgi:hypothetical protein
MFRMAGITNNTNLLAAANQIVVALNDISSKLDCCSDLRIELGNIRVAIQNVRLQPPISIGGGSGYYGGDSGGQYLDDTPANNPAPQVDEYVCKAANYIYGWVDYSLSGFAMFYGFKLEVEQHVLSIISASVAAAVSAPGIGPGAALVWAIVLIASEVAVDMKNATILAYLDVLRLKFADHKQEIICELYQAGINNDPEAAQAVYNTWTADLMEEVLAQEVQGFPWPLSEVHRATISYLLTQVISNLMGWYLCNLLFDIDPDVEAAEIEDPQDCSACVGSGVYDFTISQQGWEIVPADCIGNYEWELGVGFQSSRPENASVVDIAIKQLERQEAVNRLMVYGEGAGPPIAPDAYVYKADNIDGPWTWAGQTNSTNFPIEVTDLGILDKYIKVICHQFQNAPHIIISKIEYLE